MCAKKTINLKRTELQFLRNKISEKYALEEGTDLSLNSSRNSYAALKRGIRNKLKGKVDFYISEYLLFKLYYETKHSSEACFNLDFINTLYFYLTEGKKNRFHYFNFSSEIDHADESSGEMEILKQVHLTKIMTPSRKENAFLEGFRFRFSLFINNWKWNSIYLGLFILGIIFIVYSFKGSNSSNKMHCTYWVCKYENGTKVWSRFEGNTTYKDVCNYYEGNAKKNNLNCEAFRMENNSRISICYDNSLAKQYISDFGKIKCVYRE